MYSGQQLIDACNTLAKLIELRNGPGLQEEQATALHQAILKLSAAIWGA